MYLEFCEGLKAAAAGKPGLVPLSSQTVCSAGGVALDGNLCVRDKAGQA